MRLNTKLDKASWQKFGQVILLCLYKLQSRKPIEKHFYELNTTQTFTRAIMDELISTKLGRKKIKFGIAVCGTF